MSPYTVDRSGRVWLRESSGEFVYLGWASVLLDEVLTVERARELATKTRERMAARAAEWEQHQRAETERRELAQRQAFERSG